MKKIVVLLLMFTMFYSCKTTQEMDRNEKDTDEAVIIEGKVPTEEDKITVDEFSKDFILHLDSFMAVFGGETNAKLYKKYIKDDVYVFVTDKNNDFIGVTMPFQMLSMAGKEFIDKDRIEVLSVSELPEENTIEIENIFGSMLNTNDIVTIARSVDGSARSYFIWSYIRDQWRLKAMDGNEEKISLN